jgi:signal peptidase I
VLIPIRVVGPSMLPTYPNGGVNLVYRLAFFRSPPQRGDVVAIRTSGESIMYMKRIVGLPGETVQFHQGRLFVNGQMLDEPYLKLGCDWESKPKTLGPDRYYVVGDNRSMAERDHDEGITQGERIVGKILLCKNLFASSSPSR